jgi:DNA-binding beta-propeller fold protein YncE
MPVPSAGRRSRLVVLAAVCGSLFATIAGVVLAWWLLVGGSPSQGKIAAGAHGPEAKRRSVAHLRLRWVEHQTATLSAPIQDAAVVGLDAAGALLLGGLSAQDTSRDAVLLVGPRGAHALGRLPTAVHDAAAVRLDAGVYVFGGGTGSRQLDTIARVDTRSGASTTVGRLPSPSSDHAAAVLDGTAYLVGGYTGNRWLDTIVAWRPGSSARIAAHLPAPVRYAAVGAANGVIVIAGGSLPNGTASSSVLEYLPATGRVVQIGRLPAPTTHAAAASLGNVVYVIGGRGALVGTQTARIVAINLRTRGIRLAGALASPRSDLAAATLGKRILLEGGRDASGALSQVSELVAQAKPTRAATSTAAPFTTLRGNVYAYDATNMLTGASRLARPLVYVPNSGSRTVDVIDPRTYRIVEHFAVGALPQHVVPAWDLRTLYVTNDMGNSLTPVNPTTGRPGRPIGVDDPYNMYFTPDGRHAIVVAERLRRLDFRDPHTFTLRRSLPVPCVGVDHIDFSADGSYLLASCEFSGQIIKVNVRGERVVGVLDLPDGRAGMPQDVKLSPDGRVFYVADMNANGLWEIAGDRLKVIGFLPTGRGVHGLYPSRDGKFLYATNRSEGSISVISFGARKAVAKWRIPGGGSPDMGGVSADGKVLWLSGRYNAVVYAISTRNGRLLAKIRVGQGPHGLCVWPQPGRYSLGHTGNMR